MRQGAACCLVGASSLWMNAVASAAECSETPGMCPDWATITISREENSAGEGGTGMLRLDFGWTSSLPAMDISRAVEFEIRISTEHQKCFLAPEGGIDDNPHAANPFLPGEPYTDEWNYAIPDSIASRALTLAKDCWSPGLGDLLNVLAETVRNVSSF